MDGSLMEQRRVCEEGFRIVKHCCMGRIRYRGNVILMTVPYEEVTANYVPAAAVIRRWQALSGIIGRKGRVGGNTSLM